ncbi:MAG: hypothetical protein EBU01_10735, partial [Crocinitomicaceae bacterium]|nr:hypothetical protein [Crocinitomicaceae bacterium]
MSIFSFTIFSLNTSFSQGSQDCLGAISVCQNTYTQSSSFSGFGTNQEIFNTCLANNEQASVWYKFTVQTSGTFGFNISTLNDYDWALYDLTGTSCANIPNLTPVRCNFSAQFGNTGLSLPASGTASISDGAGASPFTAGINAIAGRTYALVIDNYTQDLNGYTLSFTGTASFIDNTAPAMTSLTDNCYQNYVTLTLSEPIQCSSISAGGSDFLISGPGSPTITGAAGVGCPAGGTTNQVMVYYNATGTGLFTLTSKVGNDGNTLLDICGNTLPVGQSLSFNHLGTVTATASPYTICAGGTSTLTATNGSISGATYSWVPTTALSSSNTIPVTATPSVTTIYTLSITYGGCTKSDTARVFVNSAPTASISPQNTILCSGGTVNLTATSIVNGVACTNCSYTWNSGAYSQNTVASSTWINQGVGTYTVVASTPNGCQGSIASTTISSPSNPPTGAACNVIYASSTGTGSGLVNTSPTSLANAITLAQCSNSIIKLAVGQYNLSSTLSVGSLMTLEGGYINNFGQKVSTDGTALTTTIIYRDALNIQGLPTAGRIVALDATGASFFRLQDITIQTANAPATNLASPYGISTYGLYLASCSNYDIVRCRILPGNASAGFSGQNGFDGSSGSSGSQGNKGNS